MERDKFRLPGWKIEKRFNTNVLLGNWSEERRMFRRGGNPFGNSTNREDYRSYYGFQPDKQTRREATMRNAGIPHKFFFAHHGNVYDKNHISLYDQHMNQRDPKESSLPNLRKWDSKAACFLPEKSDYPLQGKGTEFGLLEKKETKWKQELKDDSESKFSSTYKCSYNLHPNSSYTYKHFAPPKVLSSSFHSNTINKNLPFRNAYVNLAPEFQPPPKSI